ncbi:DUF4192 domain-containing protein [Nocardia sp. NPDC087230]|uniref:DUF4192 domain-containing protein n=1 Tax=Nocardia sp. NPDC087230 TaxID=3364331 RepID=UPI0038077798
MAPVHERPGSNSHAHLAGAAAPDHVRVDDAGQLIAAIPAMLRFVPTRSLVLAMICPTAEAPRAIRLLVRFDLDTVTNPTETREVVAYLEWQYGNENATAALVIIVDDRPHATGTARMVIDVLRASAMKLTRAWLVPTITAGETYRALLDGDTDGTVNDPATSPLARALTPDGVQIHNSRTDLLDLIAVDPAAVAQLAPLIGPAVAAYRTGLAAALAADLGTAFRRDAARAVLDKIAVDSESGRTPNDLAAVVAALRDMRIRDAMLGLSGTRWAPAAQTLWQSVARASTGRDRAEAAMLCGYDAYHRSDAVYARICLQAALHADSEHSMAVVLNTALDHGERPDRIAMIAHTGRAVAADLGIDLTTAI